MTLLRQKKEEMPKTHKVIVAIGSNHNRHANMQKAMLLMHRHLDYTVFSTAIDTAPIGIESAMFLNAIASAYTTLSMSETIAMLKGIEAECGNSAKLRNEGKIAIDIDLLQYDDERLHNADWERGYIKQLLKDLEEKNQQHPSTIKI